MKDRETAVRKSLRVFIYAAVGFVVGLAGVVWAVPGVPEAVREYVAHNGAQLLLLFGVPTSVTSLVYNLSRKDINNY